MLLLLFLFFFFFFFFVPCVGECGFDVYAVFALTALCLELL